MHSGIMASNVLLAQGIARILTVVWTDRADKIRLITGFKATKDQVKEGFFKGELMKNTVITMFFHHFHRNGSEFGWINFGFSNVFHDLLFILNGASGILSEL